MKVLIVGAGPGGLTLAYWLHRSGHQPVVIERATEFRRAGYLISLGGPGLRVLEKMQLRDLLAARQMKYEASNIIDERGRILRSYAIAQLSQSSGGALVVNRAGLQGVLYGAVKESIEVRFATTITSLEPQAHGVRATFADESIEDFELVVGADGYRSQTRALVFGAGFGKLLGASYCAFSIPNRFAFETSSYDLWAQGCYASVHPYSEEEVGAYFIWETNQPAQLPAPERRAFLLRQFGRFTPLYRRVLESLTDDDVIFHDVLAQIEMPRWHRERIVLLGDAAHCLTLVSGQGASMAMAGAHLLAHELSSGVGWETAVRNYEGRLRPSIEKMQQRAVQALGWVLGRNKVNHWLMRQALRYAPDRLLLKFFAESEADDLELG